MKTHKRKRRESPTAAGRPHLQVEFEIRHPQDKPPGPARPLALRLLTPGTRKVCFYCWKEL